MYVVLTLKSSNRKVSENDTNKTTRVCFKYMFLQQIKISTLAKKFAHIFFNLVLLIPEWGVQNNIQ